MAKFLTELDARLKGDKIWVLYSPLVYFSDILGVEIVVPVNFETDLSSVPRIPIVYWFWGGRAHREGVVHDYLYRKNSNPIVSFSQANDVFLEAMRSRGKGAGIRYPMYWGVALGGYGSYHKRSVDSKF